MTDKPVVGCGHCFAEDVPVLSWQRFSNDTVHLRAECRSCGRYIRYLPQSYEDGSPTVWLELAPIRA